MASARRSRRRTFSPALIYPIKGIWYFATHRYLHGLAQSRFVPLALLSSCVLALLFLAIYLPTVAFLAIFHHQGSAWVNATGFVLGIGALLITVLFEALLADRTQVDIFDAVMVAEGYEHLVKSRRTVSDSIDEPDPVKRLGPRDKGAEFAPFSVRQILEFIVLLPLNFVPFVGVPLFLLATGYRAGPLLNRRYHTLKGFSRKERRSFIQTKSRRFSYMCFGTVYMVLELVPALSILFLLTSAAGSALWSVRMEQESVQDQPEDEEGLPPAYSDES